MSIFTTVKSRSTAGKHPFQSGPPPCADPITDGDRDANHGLRAPAQPAPSASAPSIPAQAIRIRAVVKTGKLIEQADAIPLRPRPSQDPHRCHGNEGRELASATTVRSLLPPLSTTTSAGGGGAEGRAAQRQAAGIRHAAQPPARPRTPVTPLGGATRVTRPQFPYCGKGLEDGDDLICRSCVLPTRPRPCPTAGGAADRGERQECSLRQQFPLKHQREGIALALSPVCLTGQASRSAPEPVSTSAMGKWISKPSRLLQRISSVPSSVAGSQNRSRPRKSRLLIQPRLPAAAFRNHPMITTLPGAPGAASAQSQQPRHPPVGSNPCLHPRASESPPNNRTSAKQGPMTLSSTSLR